MPYHVRITPNGRQHSTRDALALDKDADWIEEHIAGPRRVGRDIFIDGQVLSWAEVNQIHIMETSETSDQLLPKIRASRQRNPVLSVTPDRWYVTKEGRDVTDQFISGPPGTGPIPDSAGTKNFAQNRKSVMVIYGHDKEANDALFSWLRAIGLEPLEWTQLIHASGSASPFIGEVLDRTLRDVQAVVAFFTPDEYVIANEPAPAPRRLQARPNVLIEAGMALITHPTRTIIVVLGDQELPSDLAGRHYVRLSGSGVEPLNDLAGRLSDAGCDVVRSGNDWLRAGRFPNRTAPPGSTGQGNGGDEKPSGLTASADSPGESRNSSEGKQQLTSDQLARQDTEARQVLVTMEASQDPKYNRRIVVSVPLTYPVKQVDAQISWELNGGRGMTSTGFTGDPPIADAQRRYYIFRALVDTRIDAEPVIRFVDLHGNRYYQFRDHTQRFPASADWPEAVTEIAKWLGTGPST